MQLSKTRVTDGGWHHLLIELRSAKEGKDIKYLAIMTLDYGMDQVRMEYVPVPSLELSLHQPTGKYNDCMPGPAGTSWVWKSAGQHSWIWSPHSMSDKETSVVRSWALTTWVSPHGIVDTL